MGIGGVHIGFYRGNPSERDQLEDLGLDGRIILKINLKSISRETVDRSDVAQDRDKWRDLVDAVMNIRVP
jgi:hypothetical protein